MQWTKHRAVSRTVFGKEKAHKRSMGYAKPGLVAQNTSTTKDEHSWQLRFFLPGISSYLPLMFIKDHIWFVPSTCGKASAGRCPGSGNVQGHSAPPDAGKELPPHSHPRSQASLHQSRRALLLQGSMPGPSWGALLLCLENWATGAIPVIKGSTACDNFPPQEHCLWWFTVS